MKKSLKKIDILWMFYRAFSKDGIGFMLILLSVIEAISIAIFGISFYERSFMFIRSNQISFYIFIISFMIFLGIFAIIFYILSKKYDLRLHKIVEKKIYRFLILPVIILSLFVVFLLFTFFVILVNFLNDLIFQSVIGIYGNSLTSLVLGVIWLIIVRYFWKWFTSEKT